MQVIKPGEMVNNQRTDGMVDGGHKKTRREAGLVGIYKDGWTTSRSSSP